MNLNSIKFKLSVLSVLVLAAILVLYSGMLFVSYRYSLYQELDGNLQAKAQKVHSAILSYLDVLGYDTQSFDFSVNRVISQTGTHPHENKIEKLEQLWLGQARPLGFSDDFVAFIAPDGKVLARSYLDQAAVKTPPSSRDFRTAFRGHPVYRDVRIGKKMMRSVLMPFTYHKLPRERTFLIWVATPSDRLMQQMRSKLMQHVVGTALILALASMFSQAFVRRLLKPVRDITWTAKNLSTRDLSLRIKAEGADDEMKDLIDSLNQMISRLEKSFKYIAEFSSHVSHELKTPLAIMRGESELALRTPRNAEEYRRVIQSNLQEIVHMSKIIEDLLLMTKLDYQPEIFKFERFDFTEFFYDIAESARILTGEKDIRLDTKLPKEPLYLQGDAVHLRRLFLNLINNAIKFTPRKGTISLEAVRNDQTLKVSVSDTGVGIPEEHIRKIFDKFFHYDASEPDDDLSNGLGLSIARSIVNIHAGDIQVQSAMGRGSTFTVRLPLPKPGA